MGIGNRLGKETMKPKRDKRKILRIRNWTEKHEEAFSHERSKHRKAEAAPAPSPLSMVPPEEVQPNGVVLSHSGQWAFVSVNGQEHLCLVDESIEGDRVSVLAAGDAVQIEFRDGPPIVRGVAPRRTRLSRPVEGRDGISEQIIAANIDILVVVASAARPRFKAGVVDRFLIAAGAGGATPILVINKMDLAKGELPEIEQYRALDTDVFCTSCENGAGIGILRHRLEGRLSVFAGQSGVGKSSLLNRLEPELELPARPVSDSNEKGRHTTTAARLYVLRGGIRVIDTPGIRQLGLWGVSPETLAFYFPEMAGLAADCKFRNCTHLHEPGCAVREAMDAGAITPGRYNSYRRIRASLCG